MTEKNNGGPAFPAEIFIPAEAGHPEACGRFDHREAMPGMSLRDWFAGQALTGLIHRGFTELGNAEHAYAQLAYKYADAMLKARE